MPISHSSVAAGIVVAALVLCAATSAAAYAQSGDTSYLRGQDLETRNQFDSAAAAYLAAVHEAPTSLPAILGLERMYAQLGRSDSLLPVLDTAIARAPRVSALRAAQLRTLRALGDHKGMQAAFDAWRHDVPHDPTPYQEYARMLIEDGFTGQADTVLDEAQADVGNARGFAYEVAQLNAAMGKWEPSARAWRQAVTDNGYLADAAIYALMPTTAAARAAVRRALAMPPLSAPAMRVLGALELAWGSPHDAWTSLRVLRPDSAGVTAWIDFAHRAEQAGAWLIARDALAAADTAEPSPALAVRAAADALSGGDAAGAAALAASAASRLDSANAAVSALPVQLRALSSLGKPAEGARLLEAYGPHLSDQLRSQDARLLAWGWVRVGELEKARQALAASGSGGGDDAAEGWIALYEGNLDSARQELRVGDGASTDALAVLALLDRTRAPRSQVLGHAYLALAQGDTVQAASQFASAAPALPDAGSLLLATAARLYAAHGESTLAIDTWKTIVDSLPKSPEAPEADLEWARTLRRTGQNAAAAQRLEHMILTYPESALVPQARRELELTRRTVPSTS